MSGDITPALSHVEGRETPAEEAEDAEKGMEEMSEVYREKGEKLYLPESDA